MSEASYNFTQNKLFASVNKEATIRLQIEKRREILEKKLNSDTIKNKVELKVSKIASKVNSIEDNIESKTDYYRNEMTRFYHKIDAEKDIVNETFEIKASKLKDDYEKVLKILEYKKEAQEKALTAKFEEYNTYCLRQIELIEKNDTKKKDSLEQNVEILTKELEIDEEADSILSGLKVSLEQVEKQTEELRRLMYIQEVAQERIKEANKKENEMILKRQQEDYDRKRVQDIKNAKEAREETNKKDLDRQDKARALQLSQIPILTDEEEEEQKIKQEEQKKINAKIRATKVKEFFSINNRKIKYDNLSDKQDDKYQKLQSFEEKGKFLDALPIPET
jgi:hypothetical protein